jgi:hypothetical protein
MKRKYSAFELKGMALSGQVPGAPCEVRAFSASHETTVGSLNHADFVEAFVLQLGAGEQHGRILELLAACGRGFAGHKIAYRPPDGPKLTSILSVARWVSSELEGGLACAHVLEREQRVDAGSTRIEAQLPGAFPQLPAMRMLEGCRVFVPRAKTLELIRTHTRLLSDFVTRRTLTGDVEIAQAAEAGKLGLLQLFDRGTQDRKELEVLLCAALRCARCAGPACARE